MTNDDSKVARCRRLAKFRQYLAAFLACLLGFCLGTSFGWISPMQPLLTSVDSPIPETMDLDTIAWLGSINYAGSVVGTFFWGPAVDQLGRRTSSSLVAIPYMISWILTVAANSTMWLLIARVIIGLGNSGSTVNVPLFIAEVAQDDLRGFLGSFFSISVCLGVLFSYIVGSYAKFYGLAYSSFAVPIFFLVTFVWLPETPMFLWKSGKREEARESLMWYRGGDVAETERTLSKYESISSNTKKPSYKTLVATRGSKKALGIGVALMVAIQSSGLFPIINFAVKIFEMCGTSLTPYESAIILGAMQLMSSCFCSLLVDRLGRRILLMCSLITMAVSLSVLSLYLLIYKEQPAESFLKWLPIVSLSVHIIAFSGGLGAVAFVIVSEIFPSKIRGLAMSTLSLVTGVLGFLSIKLFPTLKDLLQPYGLFFFYGMCSLLFSIFFYSYLPETKNIPQSVILKILNGESVGKDDVETSEVQLLQGGNKRPTIVKNTTPNV